MMYIECEFGKYLSTNNIVLSVQEKQKHIMQYHKNIHIQAQLKNISHSEYITAMNNNSFEIPKEISEPYSVLCQAHYTMILSSTHKLYQAFGKSRKYLFEDALVEGYIALGRGINAYDLRKAKTCKVSTYLLQWIKTYVRTTFVEGDTVKLPLIKRKLLYNILNDNPTVTSATTPPTNAMKAFVYNKQHEMLSIDHPDMPIQICYGHVALTKLNDYMYIRDVLFNSKHLTELQKEVLALRYGLNGHAPHSLDQLSTKYNITKSAVTARLKSIAISIADNHSELKEYH